MNNFLTSFSYVLDDICTLIKVTDSRGDYGESIKTRTERTIFCTRKSAGQNEYFKALQEDFRAEGVLVVQASEYQNETEVIFGDSKYQIYRTYELESGYLELYLSEKVGVV